MKKLFITIICILLILLSLMTYLYIDTKKSLEETQNSHLKTSEELWKVTAELNDLHKQLDK